VQLHRSQDTYDDYHDWLDRWQKLHGTRRAREIQADDLEEWKQALAKQDLSPWTINHAVVAVKTCWSWGQKNDFLPFNRLQKVQKLDAEGRERTFSPEEFLNLLRHSDAIFRQVLLLLRLTGIRPGEFSRLTWNQVDFGNHVLVIRRHKSRRTAKTKKPRIIHRPPAAERLLLWRLEKLGHTLETLPATILGERVFLNGDGQPWKYNALRCRMRRLRVRAGIGPDENGERIVLYTARHTFGSRAAAAGVSDRRLADLMGHTDPKMTQKYIHLSDPDLRIAALKATSGYLRVSRSEDSSS
jgi:integrase/recombinase XerD